MQFLSPIRPSDFDFFSSESLPRLGDQIVVHTPEAGMPDMPSRSLVILGVPEDRGTEANAGCAQAPDRIRHYLYTLAPLAPLEENTSPSPSGEGRGGAGLYDFGNIIPGQDVEDTYYALSETLAEFLRHDNTVLLLGGSQDLTFPAYKAYERISRIINISTIDPRFDIDPFEEITSRTYMRHIVMQTPNYLFFHANLGCQNYFVGTSQLQLMDDLKFDACRLGELQHDMTRAEALLRNADLVSVDIAAVRQSDAPGVGAPSPHGFYGEQLCQMLSFAGMSDKVSCLGLFEVNPDYDRGDQTVHMAAQAAWHFIEGYFNRLGDSPRLAPEKCLRYKVLLDDQGLELLFFKSKISERWWVEVPCDNPELYELYSRHLLLPCTYADYQQAMQGEIPALWWRYYRRLHP